MKKFRLIFGLATLAFLGLSSNSAFAQGGTTGPLTWQLTGTAPNMTLTIFVTDGGTGEMPFHNMWQAPWYNWHKSINTVVIETGVTTISHAAFFEFEKMTSVTIPAGLTEIGGCAFLKCSALTSITLPTGLIAIGGSAFENCTALMSIIIPNSVTTIECNAFKGCTALTSITIPSNVTTIGWGCHAFPCCTALTSINVESGNNNYASENGILFDKNKNTLICYPGGKIGTYIIPNNVTAIGWAAFEGCTALTLISIPNNVTAIGNTAFEGCTDLTSIDVESSNNNYTSEDGVLFDKNKNTLICYPGGKIGAYVIPNSVTSIEGAAFHSCINLTSITIPNSITNIGGSPFANCTGLTSITNLNSVPANIDFYVFGGVNQSSCTLRVPAGSVKAYKNAAEWKNFNPIVGICSVIVSVNNEEYGTATGDGIYEEHETATVTAAANDGYKFVNWTKNGVEVSTEDEYSFSVTEDLELVANFEEGTGIVETHGCASLQIYPNPVNEQLTIDCGDINNGACPIVEIFNIMGQRVMSVETGRAPSLQSTSTTTINVSHLTPGVYFLRIGEKSAKFVKE